MRLADRAIDPRREVSITGSSPKLLELPKQPEYYFFASAS